MAGGERGREKMKRVFSPKYLQGKDLLLPPEFTTTTINNTKIIKTLHPPPKNIFRKKKKQAKRFLALFLTVLAIS